MRSSIKVVVRLRPACTTDDCAVAVAVDTISVNSRQFNFDGVLGEATTQTELFSEIEPVAETFLTGINATVLAYGQTGSGKSYSMGTEHTMSGIVPQTLNYIFTQLAESQFEASLSFYELYNEQVYDLLACNSWGKSRYGTTAYAKESIQLREDSSGVYLSGIATLPITTASQALSALQSGLTQRTTAATAMNAQSSRSHAILCLNLKQLRTSEDGMRTWIRSKFQFVDLAGSERLNRTLSEGDRRREGIAINSGLLALGNVIAALTEERTPSHVPYRNSKLTRLLQDSLGGNSRTFFLACVSTLRHDLAETLSTLTYAARARKIQNQCTVNISLETSTKATYPSLDDMEKLLQENASLRQQLKEAQHHLSLNSLSKAVDTSPLAVIPNSPEPVFGLGSMSLPGGNLVNNIYASADTHQVSTCCTGELQETALHYLQLVQRLKKLRARITVLMQQTEY